MLNIHFLLNLGYPAWSIPLLRAVSLQKNEGREPLFIFADAFRSGKSEEALSPSVISAFEKKLGFSLDSTGHSNVCLANHEEVMPYFRTVFSADEMLLYIFAGLPEKESGEGERDEILISYPSGVDEFWSRVELGRKRREQYKNQ